jgi:hypothetical protein
MFTDIGGSSGDFLLGLHFDPENAMDVLPRKFGFSPNCAALHSIKPFSHLRSYELFACVFGIMLVGDAFGWHH